jgi:hypothetical protein
MPVADGFFVLRSDLLGNLTVVVHGRADALVVDPGITATKLACLGETSSRRARLLVAGLATHRDWDRGAPNAMFYFSFGPSPQARATCR